MLCGEKPCLKAHHQNVRNVMMFISQTQNQRKREYVENVRKMWVQAIWVRGLNGNERIIRMQIWYTQTM